ncbi:MULTISPECIES: uracil-DNA glycosylase family protein [Rhizobium]
MLVGEQPGDQEDVTGRPFVGPPACCSIVSAVMSPMRSSITPRVRRRLHSKPSAGEIRGCAWWLGAELNILQPKLVVTLGASALYALLGPKAKLTPERGHILQPTTHPPALVTIHPLISCAFATRRTDNGTAKISCQICTRRWSFGLGECRFSTLICCDAKYFRLRRDFA